MEIIKQGDSLGTPRAGLSPNRIYDNGTSKPNDSSLRNIGLANSELIIKRRGVQ